MLKSRKPNRLVLKIILINLILLINTEEIAGKFANEKYDFFGTPIRSLRVQNEIDPKTKKCLVEKPTIFYLESEEDPILGNGTNIFWTKIEVCCDGYKPSDHDPNTCVPDCGDKCEFGTCLAPNRCICFHNYVKSADNDCVPTCPHSCLNGQCRSFGCKCNAGYELDKATGKFCRPTCSLGCKELEYCAQPGSCQCKPGYTFNKDGSCIFKCDTRCGYGDCIGPNQCRCHLGYILRDGRCQAECYQKCENGSCISKDLCTCNYGYEYDVHTTSCLPKCDGCTHGVCIAKNFCKCFKGYKWIRSSCRSCNGVYGHW